MNIKEMFNNIMNIKERKNKIDYINDLLLIKKVINKIDKDYNNAEVIKLDYITKNNLDEILNSFSLGSIDRNFFQNYFLIFSVVKLNEEKINVFFDEIEKVDDKRKFYIFKDTFFNSKKYIELLEDDEIQPKLYLSKNSLNNYKNAVIVFEKVNNYLKEVDKGLFFKMKFDISTSAYVTCLNLM